MNRVVLGVGLVVAAVGLGVLWWRQVAPAAAASPARPPMTSRATGDVPLAAPEVSVDQARTAPSVSRAAQRSAAGEDENAPPVLVVKVLEVGTTLTPFQGATVVLGSQREEYAQATTDEQGRVEFTMGRKAGLRVWVQPLEGWEPVQRDARVGFRDWGEKEYTLLLKRKLYPGGVSGWVLSAAGVPIDGADVRVGRTSETASWWRGQSDAGGFYTIDDVPEGEWSVLAHADRYVEVEIESVVVSPGRETTGVDFALPDSPTLSGRVVDEDGAPIAGARLYALPQGGGKAARVTTREDGTFALHLAHDVPHALRATKEEFLPHNVFELGAIFAPGALDIRIEMIRAATTVFVLVDEETAEPIERFGLIVQQGMGRAATEERERRGVYARRGYRAPGVEDHPGGIYACSANPGLDRYTVIAPGHEREDGEVQHESGFSNRQVVRLKRRPQEEDPR